MSGDIVDLPVRICPACGALFVEDDRMYLDPQICPRCGSGMEPETLDSETVLLGERSE